MIIASLFEWFFNKNRGEIQLNTKYFELSTHPISYSDCGMIFASHGETSSPSILGVKCIVTDSGA